MKIQHITLLVFLIIIFSCKKNNNRNVSLIVQDSKEKKVVLEKTLDTISSCKLNDKTQIVLLKSKENLKQILVKITGNIVNENININIDSLDFVNDKISKIELKCHNTSFLIEYTEQLGNNYYFTNHKFTFDKTSENYIFDKILKVESTRNGLFIGGVLIEENNVFTQYTGNENNNLKITSIFTFNGFQEGKEPVIDEYYEEIKRLKSTKNEDIQLFGDDYVLDYILNTIGINSDNLSKYNDIAYYLEQSSLFEEAIYLLNKIIKSFPNRTVAYINLGDAYWGLGNFSKAKQAYKTYIKQMKANRKEAKIPKQILERVK